MSKLPRRFSAFALAAVAALSLTACSSDERIEPQNNKQADANFSSQEKANPVPVLNRSLERANIEEHVKRNNVPDRIRYIYLLADTGGIYAYFAIKGKVTSTGAQLTPTDSIYTNSWGNLSLQGPTEDGSFGGDEGGIYFFTDTGNEIQWNGRWLLTDEPLKINVPTLTLTTK